MDQPFALQMQQAQLLACQNTLRKLNAVSEPFGLTLTEGEIVMLARRHQEALRETGRVEFGEPALGRLAFAFCDSPFIQPNEYADTLAALQDDFYAFKNDSEDLLTDDELIESMKTVFDGAAQGSLEYMESISLSELCRRARGGVTWED